jgi:hypothetical protein
MVACVFLESNPGIPAVPTRAMGRPYLISVPPDFNTESGHKTASMENAVEHRKQCIDKTYALRPAVAWPIEQPSGPERCNGLAHDFTMRDGLFALPPFFDSAGV